MKKVANSSQNTRVLAASRSVPSAAAKIDPVLAAGAGIGSVPVSPNGRRPTSEGRSRIISSTADAETPSMTQTSVSAMRQPRCSVRLASSGRNTSCPVATLAVMMPTTSPRRPTNQRVAMVAPSTSAVMPVPRPITTPHSSIRCQILVMASEPSSADTTISCAASVTLRRP